MRLIKILVLLTAFVLGSIVTAQGQADYNELLANKKYNPIRTAVPFLMIAPDSRAAGMGDVGVATSPDEGSIYWNPAKLAFIDNDLGMSVAYTPWLRQLVNDINLYHLAGHTRLDENQVISASLRYFSLGDINFTDNTGNPITTFNPNELAVTGSYARRLGDAFSMALSAKYIHSNLSGSSDASTHPGNAFAFDLGMFYTKPLKIDGRDATMNYGASFTNIGSKMSYSENTKNFLPMNMRLGGSFMFDIDGYNSIGLAVDFNKLLAPTTVWEYDEENEQYVGGETSDVAVATAIVESFSDAPGIDGMSTFEEEMKEINSSIGIEYWYDKKLAFRTGYFHEPQEKGNRKYFTVGAGLRLNVFGLDIAYLIPTAANNPLDNTIRFSLLFNFDAIAQQ
ncbi:MAG: type IX secretion system outer membrane channel protein PorV [Salinivirgaceae bacterium]